MQLTNRPFLMSARVHTMQPFSNATPIVLRRLLIVAFDGSSASFRIDLFSTSAEAIFAVVATDRFVAFAASILGMERRLFSTSDGSKTTFALRTRPVRPTDNDESLSDDFVSAINSFSLFGEFCNEIMSFDCIFVGCIAAITCRLSVEIALHS